ILAAQKPLPQCTANVRFGSKADIPSCTAHVRYVPIADSKEKAPERFPGQSGASPYDLQMPRLWKS
ncbi:MAG: hypothetical protein WBE93_17840, partial [Pseudolabrys sp.]